HAHVLPRLQRPPSRLHGRLLEQHQPPHARAPALDGRRGVRVGADHRARGYSAVGEVFASPLTPGISVLVPAFNEEAVIVESVRSLLALRYPKHEVIVVSDGSTDATLATLVQAFALQPARVALRAGIPTARVRGTYISHR